MALDPRRGCDYSWARPTKAQLDANGLAFCVRYILPQNMSTGKRLSNAEIAQLTSWGRTIVANYEYAANGPLGGFNQGVTDARRSASELDILNIPAGRPVYFSADWEVTQAQLPTMLAYLAGCASVLGKNRVGLYGSYRAIVAAANAGYKWLWQTYAWSYGAWYPGTTLRQIRNGAFPGQFDGDLCTAQVADFGQWSGDGVPTEENENEEDLPVDITVDKDISELTDGYYKVGDKIPLERFLQLSARFDHNAARDSRLTLAAVAESRGREEAMLVILGQLTSGGGDVDMAAVKALVESEGKKSRQAMVDAHMAAANSISKD